MPWNWTSSWSSGVSPRGPLTNSTGPRPGEFLKQQRLISELAGQPIRGIHQHHVQAALGGQVTQCLQARPDQRRARMDCRWATQGRDGGDRDAVEARGQGWQGRDL
jgi:hypothetical protein